MGVAQYRVSAALPAQLRQDLPTVEDLSRELPLMSVVKVRIEIERGLREYAIAGGLVLARTAGIGAMLRYLEERGLAPPSAGRLLEALRVMNEATHGMDVDQKVAERAVSIGTEFLAELKSLPPRQAD